MSSVLITVTAGLVRKEAGDEGEKAYLSLPNTDIVEPIELEEEKSRELFHFRLPLDDGKLSHPLRDELSEKAIYWAITTTPFPGLDLGMYKSDRIGAHFGFQTTAMNESDRSVICSPKLEDAEELLRCCQFHPENLVCIWRPYPF